MQKLSCYLVPRLPLFALAAAALLGLAGCEDNPFADDFKAVKYSPRYLRSAYIYTNKDAISDADEAYRVGNYRLYGVIGAGTYYPGCAPLVAEKVVRKYGSIVLAETGDRVDVDAREYSNAVMTEYAAKYNAEMVSQLGTSVTNTPRIIRDGK